MGRRLNKVAVAKLLRLCDVLDADPRLWAVYGDTFRLCLSGASDDLDLSEYVIRTLQGRGKGTVRGRQQTLKARLWADGQRTCEACGLALEWATMRPHHLMRVADGGGDERANVRVLCSLCHDKLHARS